MVARNVASYVTVDGWMRDVRRDAAARRWRARVRRARGFACVCARRRRRRRRGGRAAARCGVDCARGVDFFCVCFFGDVGEATSEIVACAWYRCDCGGIARLVRVECVEGKDDVARERAVGDGGGELTKDGGEVEEDGDFARGR